MKMNKKCPKCSSYHVQKWGKKSQEYKCQNACIAFRNKRRKIFFQIGFKKHITNTAQETNLQELSKAYGRSRRTLRKYFDTFSPRTGEVVFKPESCMRYFWCYFLREKLWNIDCKSRGKNLLWKEIDGERSDTTKKFFYELVSAEFTFLVLLLTEERVRNLLEHKFPDTPIQLCQFHQIQSITRYLSRKPKLEAGKELRTLALSLAKQRRKHSQKIWINGMRDGKTSLKKNGNPDTKKWHYTHKDFEVLILLWNNLP